MGGAPSPNSTKAAHLYQVPKGGVFVLDFINEEFELLVVGTLFFRAPLYQDYAVFQGRVGEGASFSCSMENFVTWETECCCSDPKSHKIAC